MHNTNQKKKESKFPFLSLFPMPPKNTGKQSSKTLLKRVAAESMSSKAAASLLNEPQMQQKMNEQKHCSKSLLAPLLVLRIWKTYFQRIFKKR
jgi:hypothetical protein